MLTLRKSNLFWTVLLSLACAVGVAGLWQVAALYIVYANRLNSTDSFETTWLSLVFFALLAIVTGLISQRFNARQLLPFIAGAILLWLIASIVAAYFFGLHLFFVRGALIVALIFFLFHLRKLWVIDRKFSRRLNKLVLKRNPLDAESPELRIESGLRLLESVLPLSEAIVFRLDRSGGLVPIGRSRNGKSRETHLQQQAAWGEKVEFCERALSARSSIVEIQDPETKSARIALPLTVNDGWIVGALFIKMQRDFEPEDKFLIESFGEQLARNFQRNELKLEDDSDSKWWRFFSTRAAQYRLELATLIDSQLKEYTYGSLASLHLKESHAIAFLDGTLAYLNRNMRLLADLESSQIRSINLFGLLDRFQTELFTEPALVIRKVLQTGEPFRCELELPSKNKVLDLNISLIKVANDGGSLHDSNVAKIPACFLVTLRDITAEKENEKLRSDMAKLMSHELRTPVTSIKGFAELLLADESISADGRDFLQIIVNESQRLSKMLSTFLSVSHLQQSDKREFTREPVKLDTVVHQVINEFESEARKKRIRLMENPQKNIPPIAGDKGLLQRAISQLIDNAIRYSPERTQVIISTLLESEFLRVEVEDRGYGIHPADHEKIWEKFYRVTRDGQDKHEESTGLGLSLVKEIVEQHGGKVAVESAVGQGSKFTIRIPRL
jgi:two-component system phosphate regulon sensor histidine kinase PhoR